MEAKRTAKQVIDWLKAAEKRQQDWQQEVKKRCLLSSMSSSPKTTM
jgi:hypothetical protein